MKRKVKEMPGVIIVTGSAEGIGAEICQGLAADGLKVVVAEYTKDAAEKTAADIRRQSEKPFQFKSTSGIERDDWGRIFAFDIRALLRSGFDESASWERRSDDQARTIDT